MLLAGPVETASHEAVYGPTGVDEMVVITLRHRSGVLSQLLFGFRYGYARLGPSGGDAGRIEIPDHFHYEEVVRLVRGADASLFELAPFGAGRVYKATAFQNYIEKGDIGLAEWPPAATLACARILERVKTTHGMIKRIDDRHIRDAHI